MRKFCYGVFLLTMIISLIITGNSCGGTSETTSDTIEKSDSAPQLKLPDTLRVATLYGPLSFFLFREDTMGYDYTLVRDFAESKGLTLEMTVAGSLDKALAMLDSGHVDVVAYGVPVISTYLDMVHPCGPEISTTQVLVQQKNTGEDLITDVTQLVGKDVWVPANSKYAQRLENLNNELGGGITIHTFSADSVSDDDIFRKISKGDISLSVVDNDIARLNQTYYNNIDVSLPVSFGQRSAWAVAPDKAWLGDSITSWFKSEGAVRENEVLLKKYFEQSKNGPVFNLYASLANGRISPYDDIFKTHAARIGWDWRILAAQGFVESQYNNDLVSWAGARGIMQIMPSTARAYGIRPETLTDPETCIALGADILKATEDVMARYVSEPDELKIFAIAAYNSGIAHVIDAIALAQKYGLNPAKWEGNVENALLMKGEPRYYNDPVVKYGYFRGYQTTEYVNHVYDFYERVRKHVR